MKCDVCSRDEPADEMIAFEGRWICAACKPVFVQQLREGVLPPQAPPLPEGFDERMLGFGELVGLSGRLIRQGWLTMGVLMLLVAVPMNLALAGFEPRAEPTLPEFWRYLGMVMLLETVFAVFAMLGIAHVANEALQGRSVPVGEALAHAARTYLPGVGASLLGSLVIGLGMLALIVPGILYLNYYAFIICLVSLRGARPQRALAASKALVQGRWWRVAGRMLGLTCLPVAAAVVFTVPVLFLPESAALSLLHDLLIDLFSVFSTVGTTVLFLNLEAIERREHSPSWGAPLP